MLYRKMDKTGVEVSILGFGCMRLPTLSNGKINENESEKMLLYALEKGVNYIDTAYPYHQGQSELFVGNFLHKHQLRDRIYLATKLPSWLITSHKDMEYYLNQQLKRLQTDYIDFYLLHSLNHGFWSNLLQHDVFRFLKKVQQQGKIGHFGFSFHYQISLFKKIIDSHDWDFCQIQYNFLDENFQAGREGLYYAYQKGVDVIIMEPIKGGKITENIPETAQKIWQNAPVKRSPAAWALRWVWHHPQVTMLLSGMSTLQQVKENIQTADDGHPDSLTQNEIQIMDMVKNIYKDQKAINCTACEYCLPCPYGVNIPQCLSAYNQWLAGHSDLAQKTYQHIIDENGQASLCQACGECEQKCPQQLPIRKLLHDANRALV